jgi:hypothetical protein
MSFCPFRVDFTRSVTLRAPVTEWLSTIRPKPLARLTFRFGAVACDQASDLLYVSCMASCAVYAIRPSGTTLGVTCAMYVFSHRLPELPRSFVCCFVVPPQHDRW